MNTEKLVKKVNKIDNIEEQLDNIANKQTYDVEDFKGDTDYQKLQKALDFIIDNKKHLTITKDYDITGNTLNLKQKNERYITLIRGNGGSIRKNDDGFVFDSVANDNGDFKIKDVYFYGNGMNTYIFNCDNIIRLTLNSNSLFGIRMLKAENRWVQTVRSKDNLITGHSGWAYEYNKCYDLTIDGDVIEHGENGIKSSLTNNPSNNTLRILNCVIEGLNGVAIELGSTFGCTISGNYFEANNGGYISLCPEKGFHQGLNIFNNSCQQTEEQLANDIPFITLKDIGNYGVNSNGNVSTGLLYEYKGNTGGALGNLVIIGDSSISDKLVELKELASDEQVIYLGKSDTNSFNKSEFLTTNNVTSSIIANNEETTVFIASDFNPWKAIINVNIEGSGNNNFEVLKIKKFESGVDVTIKNKSLDTQYFICSMSAIKIK